MAKDDLIKKYMSQLSSTILWVDDEIDLLRPHIIFLEEKGYRVLTATNGMSALETLKKNSCDLVFLDEQMPGLSGMDTLSRLKTLNAHIPVIMVTKSEEENIMEDAIGAHISDYLIKPVKPTQLLLALKKHLETKRIVSEKSLSEYQKEFRSISMNLAGKLNYKEWMDAYKKLVYWDLALEDSGDRSMSEILHDQKEEANRLFSRFVEENYLPWLHALYNDDVPLLSHRLLKEKLFPLLKDDVPVFLVLVDNLRYDQWKTLESRFAGYFHIDTEEIYFSILPTTTQYARNAIFSGLMPSDLERRYPDLWMDEDEEGSKNRNEAQLLAELLERNNLNIKTSYYKIVAQQEGKKLAESLDNLFSNKLNVIVYNFVDALSHARTDVPVVRELAADESAYRAVTLSWFDHSPLLEIIRKVAEKKCHLLLTTDHGSVRVSKPAKVIGTRELNANLRYKRGQSIQYDKKDVLEIKDPLKAFLPKQNMNSVYIFAKQDLFFAYPNNYNHYVKHYQNTFQHGGISMEEMMVPVVAMRGKQ